MADEDKPAYRRKDPDPLGGRPAIESMDIGDKTYLVAKVQPLDVTGISTVTFGTVAWVVAFVVMLIFRDSLRSAGHEWWLWVPVAGFVLGVLGIAYCRRRARRIAADPDHVEESVFGAAGS